MKLANAPGRKLTRRRVALSRLTRRMNSKVVEKVGLKQPGSTPRKGLKVTRPRIFPRTEKTLQAEFLRLTQLCGLTDGEALRTRTKRDHSFRAKMGRQQ